MSSILRRLVAVTILLVAPLFAQETTGGLQGTVKESSGAVVANAQVVVTSNSLIGNKPVTTDASGYYRFANLPPGSYMITVTAKGFATAKREGLVIEVGHLPTVDITLEVGAPKPSSKSAAQLPLIDVTRNHPDQHHRGCRAGCSARTFVPVGDSVCSFRPQ